MILFEFVLEAKGSQKIHTLFVIMLIIIIIPVNQLSDLLSPKMWKKIESNPFKSIIETIDYSGLNTESWTILLELIKTRFESTVVSLESVQLKHITDLKGGDQSYKHDVVVPPRSVELEDIVGELLQRAKDVGNKNEQLRTVSSHGHHIHVVHSCTNLNASCHCTWLQICNGFLRFRRRRSRRRIFCNELKIQDWKNIFRYLSTNGRKERHFGGGNTDGRFRIQIENVRVRLKYFFF